MQSFQTWLAESPLATYLKSFVAIIISAAVADWAKVGAISLANWQTWIIAGAVSVAPLLVNYLNPSDSRYGRGKAE